MQTLLPLLLTSLLSCGPRYEGLAGTETVLLGRAQASPDEADCELRWSAKGTAIHPLPRACDGCTYAFDVQLTFDEDASTVLDGCEDAAVDRTVGYAVGKPYEDDFTWLYIRADNTAVWQPWPSTVSFDGETFSYTEGYEDHLYTGDAGYYPEYDGLYFTSLTEFVAGVE